MRLNNLELKYYYDSKFEIVNFRTQKDEKEPIFEAILNAEKYHLNSEQWHYLIDKSPGDLTYNELNALYLILNKYDEKYIKLKDETWNLLINKSTLAIQRIDLIQNIFSKYNKKLEQNNFYKNYFDKLSNEENGLDVIFKIFFHIYNTDVNLYYPYLKEIYIKNKMIDKSTFFSKNNFNDFIKRVEADIIQDEKENLNNEIINNINKKNNTINKI